MHTEIIRTTSKMTPHSSQNQNLVESDCKGALCTNIKDLENLLSYYFVAETHQIQHQAKIK